MSTDERTTGAALRQVRVNLKGTISAMFSDIEINFRALAIISAFPAVLMLLLALLSKMITLIFLSFYVIANKDVAWLARINFLPNIIIQVIGFYVCSLWFTVVVAYITKRGQPYFIPSLTDMKNAIFVFLYGVLFFIITSLIMFGFVQFVFFYAGVAVGTLGTVTIPWRQSGPLLVFMPLILILLAWFSSVTHVNMPRIAMGYRPNLFTEVIRYSKGVQTGLTLRLVGLFIAVIAMMMVFAFFLGPAIMAATVVHAGMPNPNNLSDVINYQMTLIKASMLVDPFFLVFTAFFLWMFSLFLIEASWRIERRT